MLPEGGRDGGGVPAEYCRKGSNTVTRRRGSAGRDPWGERGKVMLLRN